MRRIIVAALVALCAVPGGAWALSVCLDPGHGGSDAGALGAYYTEKAANLDVGLWAQAYLRLTGGVTSIGMTRTSDVYVSLADRCSYANAAGFDRFLSQHHNAATGTAQGTETYCYPAGSSASFDLRDRVQPRLVWAFAYADRGGKTADFYVLRNTVMPAILGEASFIDYAGSFNESQRFSTHENDHDGREGYGYCWGLCDHAGLIPPVYGPTAVAAPRDPGSSGVRVVATGRGAWIEVGGRTAVPLTVRDIRGRSVRRWPRVAGRLLWDGRDDGGRPAAAGVYWVTAGQAARARLVVLRPPG